MSNNEWHRELMRNYYAARDAYELAVDIETRGYATEKKECTIRPVTFKSFLIGIAR
jgi:hypothetical protein